MAFGTIDILFTEHHEAVRSALRRIAHTIFPLRPFVWQIRVSMR